MGYGGYSDWGRYVPVAERKAKARQHAEKLKKQGRALAPIEISGNKIATTFWGKAWCDHLESYSDYSNRLPRGRTYVRNGSVIDLQIKPGRVNALVMGSSLYEVTVTITALDAGRWRALVGECAGRIGSLVELLQGKLSDGVLGILADRNRGLFPAPREIRLQCSCPDAAVMCKHVAAVLYGVGKRLDERPELFFTLRQVDQADLIARATDTTRLGQKAPTTSKRLAHSDLSSVFGIELDPGHLVQGAVGASPNAVESRPTRRTSARKATKTRATSARTASRRATPPLPASESPPTKVKKTGRKSAGKGVKARGKEPPKAGVSARREPKATRGGAQRGKRPTL